MYIYRTIFFYLIISFAIVNSIYGATIVKEQDKNNDKKTDTWIYYDNNRPIKIESDRNYDGKIDLWIYYGNKGEKRTEVDLNFDGKPDMYTYYKYGERTKLEIDTDYDGKLDQVNEYMNGKLVKMQKTNKDGKLETIFDITGRYSSQQKHTEYHEADPQPLDNSKTFPEKQKAQ